MVEKGLAEEKAAPIVNLWGSSIQPKPRDQVERFAVRI